MYFKYFEMYCENLRVVSSVAILEVTKNSSQDFQNGTKSNFHQPQLNFSFSVTERARVEKLNQEKLFKRFDEAYFCDKKYGIVSC